MQGICVCMCVWEVSQGAVCSGAVIVLMLVRVDEPGRVKVQ